MYRYIDRQGNSLNVQGVKNEYETVLGLCTASVLLTYLSSSVGFASLPSYLLPMRKLELLLFTLFSHIYYSDNFFKEVIIE